MKKANYAVLSSWGYGLALVVLVAIWSSASAQSEATRAYESGDVKKAFSLWQARADAGEADAQYALGVLFHRGDLGFVDDDKAVSWFRQAASNNHLEAMFNLGIAYWEGRGVPPDPEQAFRWWRRAAELGFAPAQHNLATMYYMGKGVESDLPLALAWFRRAAKNGHQESEKILAMLGTTTTITAASDELPQQTTAPTASVVEQMTPPPAAGADPESGLEAETVSVYAFAAAGAPVVGTISARQRPRVLSRTRDWFRVSVPDGVLVWVYGRYIDSENGPGRVTGSQVRARPQPSTAADAPPIGLFDTGDSVEVVEVRGDWKRVRVTGRFTAWARAKDITHFSGVLE